MNEIVIVLIGVIVGGVLTIARDLYNEHRAEKKRAMYLALKVTFTLDDFFLKCTEIAGDDGYTQGGDEQGCAVAQTTCPELDLYSLDVDWQSIAFYLMYETLSLHTLINTANDIISAQYEFVAGPPDYHEFFDERQYQYAKLGLEANRLSSNLRQFYKIPSKHYENWNPINYLKEQKLKIEKARKKREQITTTLQKNV